MENYLVKEAVYGFVTAAGCETIDPTVKTWPLAMKMAKMYNYIGIVIRYRLYFANRQPEFENSIKYVVRKTKVPDFTKDPKHPQFEILDF